MEQPAGLSARPAIVNRACTPPSGERSSFLMNRASRIGPLAVMKEGTVFPGAMVGASVTWGLGEGLDPPTAGWAWQPSEALRLKRGPSPLPTPSTSFNVG